LARVPPHGEGILIAVIIPAHDEERHLPACLRSVARAAECAELAGESVRVIVVLDACTDGSARVAARHGAQAVRLQARNVGKARAAGAALALEQGARWLSFTDADSEVAPDWIAAQLAEAAQCVCGTVQVADWSGYGTAVRRQYEAAYRDEPGHRHIHGANLGVCAQSYQAAGGFAPLRSHEDVALVEALAVSGARIAWSNRPRVRTSARADYRAPQGFGAYLDRLHAEALGVAA